MDKSKLAIMLLCILSGLTVGYFIGSLPFMDFMNFEKVFGIDQPLTVNFGFIVFSIQFKLRLTISSIIGLVLGIVLFKWTMKGK